MNTLRSWAVVYGLGIVLALPGTTYADNSSVGTPWLSDQTTIFTWVTGLVMGAQLLAVIVMMVRGIWLRRKEGPQRRRGRMHLRNQPAKLRASEHRNVAGHSQ